ncbi:hypothetical protein [Maricaulis sp. W15]|uniref:hypothetical protein n=1 Tax=Maricaulis sp. W15 TaxID=1772333 RepID=UPI000ADCC7E8|nr:hypothetical protein [Maricaulis sp. W15]
MRNLVAPTLIAAGLAACASSPDVEQDMMTLDWARTVIVCDGPVIDPQSPGRFSMRTSVPANLRGQMELPFGRAGRLALQRQVEATENVDVGEVELHLSRYDDDGDAVFEVSLSATTPSGRQSWLMRFDALPMNSDEAHAERSMTALDAPYVLSTEGVLTRLDNGLAHEWPDAEEMLVSFGEICAALSQSQVGSVDAS